MLAGTAFRLLLLVIAVFPGGVAGQGAGDARIACDVIASVGLIWTARGQAKVGQVLFSAARVAGHLLADVWSSMVSILIGGATMPADIAFSSALRPTRSGPDVCRRRC